MRILILSNKIPYPAFDGGSIATLNLGLSLAKLGNQITLLAMNTDKHYFPLSEVPSEIRNQIEFRSVDVPARISWVAALKNFLFSKKPYTAERFYAANYEEALVRLLQSKTFDLLQLEGLYMGLYLPIVRKWSKAKIVYRAHNLEFEIWERAALRSGFLKKKYYANLSARLLKLEKCLLSHYDAIVPISDKDGLWFQEQLPNIKLHICPAGIGEDFGRSGWNKDKELDLFYIGALDWLPNQEGLLWFFKNVWPIVNLKYPWLKFYLAGRNASDEMKALKAPNLIFLGEIENAADFIQSHSIMVVPLFSGSGMRIKIIEAMAKGKVVITTSLGIEGNHAKNKQEVLIANDVAGFVSQIDYAFSDPERIQEIGNLASKFVSEYFDQQEITKKLQLFYFYL